MNGRASTTPGAVSVLNVGAGDTKLSFDPSNQAECIRAARIVKDMLRRGYALLIEVDGKMVRALDFREDVFEYVIADFDPVTAAKADENEESHGHQQGQAGAGAPAAGEARGAKPGSRGPYKKRGVPAAGVGAVAVAASAGG